MSNSERGNEFKERVGRYLRREGYAVEPEYAVKVGFPTRGRKKHRFDFGSDSLLVECKSYSPSSYTPSGKIATLNESMLYFHAARGRFRKMMFIAQAPRMAIRDSETFAEHYVRLYGHLIPRDVEIWELSGKRLAAVRVDTATSGTWG